MDPTSQMWCIKLKLIEVNKSINVWSLKQNSERECVSDINIYTYELEISFLKSYGYGYKPRKENKYTWGGGNDDYDFSS